MQTETQTQTPREIDKTLAALYGRAAKAEAAVEAKVRSALDAAGARYYYRGRRRVTDMTFEEATKILVAKLGERHLSLGRTHREILDEVEAARQALREISAEIRRVAAFYTGWSRFFVVTSSNGHIHRSRDCSTCRWTTTYGWLPNLSGKSESEAIEFFGPAAECLCSVCFPDAPVATKDLNLSARQTEDLLAGRTPEATAKKVYCPGSGSYAETRSPGARYGNCPHCGYSGALLDGGRMRKHAEATR